MRIMLRCNCCMSYSLLSGNKKHKNQQVCSWVEENQKIREKPPSSRSSCCIFNPKMNVWLTVGLLCSLLCGSGSQLVTQTPSVVVTGLGHNVTLDCQFIHTAEQQVTEPILYWYYRGQSGEDLYIYPPQKEQPNRVLLLHEEQSSANWSIVLQEVRWEDWRKYHCMLSYDKAGRGKRTRGGGAWLLLHGPMSFDLAPWASSSLACSVEVSPHPDFSLTVLRGGVVVQSMQNRSDTPPSDAPRSDTPRSDAPHSMLSVIVPLDYSEDHECRLSLNGSVILSQTFSSRVEVLPEPVFLYAAILLVPVIVLFIILIVFLTRRR
ncbi:hypothetical protein MATL_G00124470 [Megalops atlanticus]|uniref:Ig-like domain-containing protein n=1 Tax=Megalops atlanticus TaxID=7932 RepID=A0A9D3PXE9_MEGAT|nr:hypothetical protein MATL_G00124470 [Megalops atlanticus]